jgi:glyoxylase-like metal-dependent hydrolase (beta-lactamase superfamily II)
LQAVSAAEVIAHPLEAARLARDHWRGPPGNRGPINLVTAIADRIYARWPHHAVRVTRTVEDGDELPGGWIAVHTPGHTPGHTSYFHPAWRILIAGDALGGAYDGRPHPPMRIYTEDSATAARSIRKLAALEPQIICFGHGPVLRDAAQALSRLAGIL